MKCYKQCQTENQSCDQTECRLWINYQDDLNCTMVAINKHPDGKMTLREVADRLGISFVRVKQIEEKAKQAKIEAEEARKHVNKRQ